MLRAFFSTGASCRRVDTGRSMGAALCSRPKTTSSVDQPIESTSLIQPYPSPGSLLNLAPLCRMINCWLWGVEGGA